MVSTKKKFFIKPTWLFYYKFNLLQDHIFSERYLYILSKYHAIFKILQWNARQCKIYSRNSSVIHEKFSIYRLCIKSSIEVLKFNSIHQIWDQNNPYILWPSITNCIYAITFEYFQNTTKWKELLFLFKRTTFVCSKFWLVN